MSERVQRWLEKSGIVWKVLEDTSTYQKLEQTSLVLVPKNEYAELKADSKRLDTILSWHGVNWFFAWFEDAENTNPPTRADIDKLEEQDHE